jgi:hypothetical protein
MSTDVAPELINWKTITEDNSEDPVKDILEKAGQLNIRKSAKGRPRKIVPAEPLIPAEPVPVTMERPLMSAEESLSTLQLVETLRRSKSQSPPKRKSTLRFSTEEPNKETPENVQELDSDRTVLLRMYRQYFKRPLLDKHGRKEIHWTDKHMTSEIYQEIKKLNDAVKEDDPAAALASGWVQMMVGVEAAGPMLGIASKNLGTVAECVAGQDDLLSTMRELLIKYPYLRKLIGLGGYPELKLLALTSTVIRQVHEVNLNGLPAAPPREVPADLRTAFNAL